MTTEFIISTVNTLSSLPVNIWAYMLFLVMPFSVFIVKPMSSFIFKFMSLALFILIVYFLINLSIHNHIHIENENYIECQGKFDKSYLNHVPQCGKLKRSNGATLIFALFLGWIPAIAYIGIWEFVWRIVHRKKLKSMHRGSKWLSNIVILFAIICYVIYPLILIDLIIRRLFFFLIVAVLSI